MQNHLKIFVILVFCWFPLSEAAQEATGTLPPLKKIRRTANPLTFSEGYILGYAHTAELQKPVLKNFEAEVMLGLNSIPGGFAEEDCIEDKVKELEKIYTQERRTYTERYLTERAAEECTARINPFYLSSYDSNWKKVFTRTPNQLELIRYRANSLHPFLESPYIIEELIPVGDYLVPKSFDDGTRKLGYGVSHVDGRVVLASLDGVVRKHYHLVIQLGHGGGQFAHVDLTTSELFDYVVNCMATGKLLRIHYFVLLKLQAAPSKFIMGYGNHLRGFKVDILE